MYRCLNCEAVFEEPEVKEFTEMVEYWGAMVPMVTSEVYCPKCGDEEFEEIDEIEEDEEEL